MIGCPSTLRAVTPRAMLVLLTTLALAGNPEVTPDGPDGRGVLTVPEAGRPQSDGVGDLVVEAAVPVEVVIDGRPVAQVFATSTIRVPTVVGTRTVTLLVNGSPTKLLVDVPEEGEAVVVVGRTGITTRVESSDEDKADNAKVELRVVGNEGLRITLGRERYRMAAGTNRAMELTRGDHELEIRSGDGLAVYAVGDLMVHGTGPVIVHLSAGRAPEVIGRTGSWLPTVR